jgi:membrane-bound inhibitor of C-type lysozyme
MNKFLIFVALIIILIFGGLYFLYQMMVGADTQVVPVIVGVDNSPTLISKALYMCKENRAIEATYYESKATTTIVAGQPPVLKGSVKLLLSDTRTFDVPQTASASGVRYANPNESFVFWNKGNEVLVLEDDKEKMFMGCMLIAPAVTGVNLPAMYVSTDTAFSVRLPSIRSSTTDGYAIDETFKNTRSPKLVIDGVKFTIPQARATSTNLSRDTYLSVENIPSTQACTANLFFEDAAPALQKTENGVAYSVATFSSAAAGNRYLETVYAIPGTSPCIGVRYMVHYTAIENYATGTVSEFNQVALTTEFDQIRRTLVVNQ